MAKKGQTIRPSDALPFVVAAVNEAERDPALATKHRLAARIVYRFGMINASRGALGDRRGRGAGTTHASRHDDTAALAFARNLEADDPKPEPYRFARLAAERFHPGADLDQRTAIIKRLVRKLRKGRDR